MELIVIGESKVKIMLSQKDMIKYSLNVDNINYDSEEAQNAFRSILTDVKSRTGFDALGSRLSLKVFPCRAGGCEIFVSKLEEARSQEFHPGICAPLHIGMIYKFTSFSSLLCVLNLLRQRNYSERSSVFYKDNEYFLILEETKGIDFICEYAEKHHNRNYIYHILEYCEGMCINNAVEKLAPLY